MKVVQLCASDGLGGASRAAIRLHKALLKNDIDSHVVVRNKTKFHLKRISTPYNGVLSWMPEFLAYLQRAAVLLFKPLTKEPYTLDFWRQPMMLAHIKDIDPDILHIHWTGKGTFSLEDMQRFEKPIVWTLHDMWLFTGGCHYDDGCGKYQIGCGSCPILARDDNFKITHNQQRKKGRILENLGGTIKVVALSKWIGQCAEKTGLFTRDQIQYLPNPIDTEKFKPIRKEEARESLKIPAGKQVILYGSMGDGSNPRKGWTFVRDALSKIDPHNKLLCVFGTDQIQLPVEGFEMMPMGHISKDSILSKLYSAADITLVPSLQENLSNVIMESLSCGTPVVSFDIGGNSDMISHKETGYLAKSLDASDFSFGIEYFLNRNLSEVSMACRDSVERRFNEEKVASDYIALYKSLCRSDPSFQ